MLDDIVSIVRPVLAAAVPAARGMLTASPGSQGVTRAPRATSLVLVSDTRHKTFIIRAARQETHSATPSEPPILIAHETPYICSQ
jgi:hypothetical protein